MRLCFNYSNLFFILLLATCPIPAVSETKIDSATRLVKEALENNPELNVYRAEIRSTEGDLFTAGRLANPDLSIGVGQKEGSQSGMHTGSGAAFEVTYSQTFEYPGRIRLREAIAKKQINIAEMELKRFERALAYKIKSLMFQLYLAQEQKKANEVVVSRGKSVVSILSKRETTGVALQLERSIIDASVLVLNQKAIAVAAEVEKLSYEINMLCGRPKGGIISVGSDQFSRLPLVPNDDTLVQLALNENSDIQLKQTLLDQQGLKVDLSKNQRNPSFTFSPFVSEERADDLERIVGIGISVPLPIWNDNSGEIESQEAKKTQSEYAVKVAQNEVEKEVRSRATTLRLRSAELRSLSPKILSELKDSAKKAEEHYQSGAVPVATYLQVQQQYFEGVEAVTTTRVLAFDDTAALEFLTGLELIVTPLGNPKQEDNKSNKRNRK